MLSEVLAGMNRQTLRCAQGNKAYLAIYLVADRKITMIRLWSLWCSQYIAIFARKISRIVR